MARVVSIEDRRMQDLAADLERHMAPQLHMGSVTAPLSKVDDVERWRRAARLAGRRLGWRVRTGINERGGYVWALDIREPPAEVLEAHQRGDDGAAARPDDQRGRGEVAPAAAGDLARYGSSRNNSG